MKKTIILSFLLLAGLLLRAQTVVVNENFDGVTTPALPTGWTAIDADNNGNTYRTQTTSGSMYGPASAPNFVIVGYGPGFTQQAFGDWLFTPGFTVSSGNTLKIIFYIRQMSTYGDYSMKVQAATSPAISGLVGSPIHQETWTGSKYGSGTGDPAYSYYHRLEFEYTVTLSGTLHIGLYLENPTSTFEYGVGIDNFRIELSEGAIAPVVQSVYPTDDVQDIDINTPIYVDFDRNDISDQNLSLITLSSAGNNVSITPAISGDTLYIAHSPLEYGKTYIVNIPAGAISGFAGRQFSFTTVSSQVALYQSKPGNTEHGFFPQLPFKFVFNQQVNVTDLSKITLNNQPVAFTASLDGKQLTLAHPTLQYGTTYILNIEQGAIERFDGASITFTTAKEGNIPSASALYGPVPNILNLRSVSDNGRYAVGACSGGSPYSAFCWDLLEENQYYSLGNGEALMVANTGAATLRARRAEDYTQTTGAIWYHGDTTALGNEFEAQAINSAGTIAGGMSLGSQFGAFPYMWNKQPNGQWNRTAYTYPTNAIQAQISAISDDGSVAVGRCNVGNYAQEACYWTSPTNFVKAPLPAGIQSNSYYTCISANGKYAGMYIGTYPPYIHNMEANTFTEVLGPSIINAITNDGLAVCVEGTSATGYTSYIYSTTTGVKSFVDWMSSDMETLYQVDAALKTQLLTLFSSEVRIMDISADGQNWAIQKGSDAYVLHLKKQDAVEIIPQTYLPADGASRVTANAEVWVEFDKAVSTYGTPDFSGNNAPTIKDEVQNISYTVTASIDSQNPKRLVLTHSPFDAGAALLKVTIPQGAINGLQADIVWTFTTVPYSVVLSNFSPANGTQNVAADVTVSFTNTPGISTSSNYSFDVSRITIKDALGNTVQGISLSGGTGSASGTVTIAHNDFVDGRTYTVTVPKAAITGTAYELAQNYSWSFSTPAVVNIEPIAPLAYVPQNNATLVAPDATISVEFDQPVNINGDPDFTGANKPVIFRTGDPSWTYEVTGITLSPTNNKRLVIGHANLSQGAFSHTVRIPKEAIIGLSADVEWSFSTIPFTLELLPEQLVPLNGSSNVAINSPVQFKFNLTPNGGAYSVNGSLITIKDQQGNTVEVTGFTGGTGAPIPSAYEVQHSDFAYDKIYTVTIPTTAVTGGSVLLQDAMWSFATAKPPVEDKDITVQLFTPLDGAAGVETDTEIAVELNLNADTNGTPDFSASNAPLIYDYSNPLTTFLVTEIVVEGKKISLKHDDLPFETKIGVSIPRTAIKGCVSNIDWSFTTLPPEGVHSTNFGAITIYQTDNMLIIKGAPARSTVEIYSPSGIKILSTEDREIPLSRIGKGLYIVLVDSVRQKIALR